MRPPDSPAPTPTCPIAQPASAPPPVGARSFGLEGTDMTIATATQATLGARRQRTLTELDHVRLCRLLERHPEDWHAALADALNQSNLVPPPQVAPEVVTMYTRVRVEDTATGRHHVYTLCYPPDAEPAEGFVSVLSPVGASLLGAHIGERVQFTRPDGSTTELALNEILFQPEATGDYTS
jgi:regulator of nucleoside diphosphate kinase